jgi:hypothetical protein
MNKNCNTKQILYHLRKSSIDTIQIILIEKQRYSVIKGPNYFQLKMNLFQAMIQQVMNTQFPQYEEVLGQGLQ